MSPLFKLVVYVYVIAFLTFSLVTCARADEPRCVDQHQCQPGKDDDQHRERKDIKHTLWWRRLLRVENIYTEGRRK